VTTTQARLASLSFFSASRWVPEDLHPLGVEVLGEPGQGQTRLLDP